MIVKTQLTIVVALFAALTGFAHAEFTDLDEWTLSVHDAGFSYTLDGTEHTVTLTADDNAIPSTDDISFASSDGVSTGYVFDPASDFSVAIDFDLSFDHTPQIQGGLGLGFGIGTDASGENSAGAGLFTNNGVSLEFNAAARAGGGGDTPYDVEIDFSTFDASALSGSLFVAYDADTGTVTAGVSDSQGAIGPARAYAFLGIQNEWDAEDDDPLGAAFFLRSDDLDPWQGGGTGEAVFSNVRILHGSAQPVPEPTAISLLLVGCVIGFARRTRRR